MYHLHDERLAQQVKRVALKKAKLKASRPSAEVTPPDGCFKVGEVSHVKRSTSMTTAQATSADEDHVIQLKAS